VLQCVAGCCKVLQDDARCGRVMKCVAGRCCVWKRVVPLHLG